MIGIIGARSTISLALIDLLPQDEEHILNPVVDDMPRYFIASGFLKGQTIRDQSRRDAEQAWRMNFVDVAQRCDSIIASNPLARICIVGSESGIQGSFDAAYAGAKAAMHLYVETKRLRTPEQQLVCIAPTVIEDSGMTQRRNDLGECLVRGAARRRGRWLQSADVARLAHFLLYTDDGSISNTVIRQNGGNS